mmetsp:Transcript_46267/g.75714  ORF Transcript_46267/g.75714 Transcript_46267/m.75714 type:complete len:95 (+) Transcript_46267:732-1016(+)
MHSECSTKGGDPSLEAHGAVTQNPPNQQSDNANSESAQLGNVVAYSLRSDDIGFQSVSTKTAKLLVQHATCGPRKPGSPGGSKPATPCEPQMSV